MSIEAANLEPVALDLGKELNQHFEARRKISDISLVMVPLLSAAISLKRIADALEKDTDHA